MAQLRTHQDEQKAKKLIERVEFFRSFDQNLGNGIVVKRRFAFNGKDYPIGNYFLVMDPDSDKYLTDPIGPFDEHESDSSIVLKSEGLILSALAAATV